MTTVILCVCGCGEPATHAARHTNQVRPALLTEADYTVEDRGYNTPCWISVIRGAEGERGYVMARVAGRKVLAHRAMYAQANGPIPDGLWIDHLCKQKRCMRPDHLEAVTPAENKRRASNAKLTLPQVRDIRAAEGRTSARSLAAQYGVNVSLIYQIWRHQCWPDP